MNHAAKLAATSAAQAIALARSLAAALVGRLLWEVVWWCGDPRAPRCPMSRHQTDPLRPLTADERQELTRLSRSLSAPAAQVERARALLAILGHCGWRQRHGGRLPYWTTAHRDPLRLGEPLQPQLARRCAAGAWGWTTDPLWR